MAALAAALCLFGCRSPAGGSDSGDSGVPQADPPDPSGAVVLGDENNYSFTGELDGPSSQVAELADVSLSWADLDKDLQCHDLDPVDDIDNAVLLVFPRLTEAEVEAGMSDDSLEQVDLGVYLSQEPGDATSVNLSEFTFFGTDSDIEQEFVAGSGTWMVILTTGTTVGVGVRMMAFLEPTPGETAMTASVDDGCSVLDYTVDLQSLKPVGVLPDGPWALDWTSLTMTGQATDFETTKVDSVMLAWFDELTLGDVEDRFLDLEQLADEMWTLEHNSGTTADLAQAVNTRDDTNFTGFTASGTWLLALRCSTCPNPAPLMLTVLEPFFESSR